MRESQKVEINQKVQIREQEVSFLFTGDDLRKIPARVRKLLSGLKKKQNGAVLLVLLLYVLIICMLVIMDPMLSAALSLKHAWTQTAIKRAEYLVFSTTSPIRTKLVNDIYDRVQKQLIDHIQKSKGSSPYICQGVEVQPTTIDPNAKLENQFGLCEPEKLLDGLNGETNQTIDYLPVIFPNYKTPLEGENEVVRQAIIWQNTNSYFYRLTNTYVGQEVLNDASTKKFKEITGFKRQESYRWMIQAYTEATLTQWGNVTRGAVAYFDVTLSNSYYPGNFGGGENNCTRTDSVPQACPDGPGTCMEPFYTDSNGVEWPAHTGPCPRLGTGAGDQCQIKDTCTDHGPIKTCPLVGGGTASFPKVFHTRPQLGCASLNSGRSGKIVDDQGYTFVLVVRLVSYGNTYN